MQLTKSGEAKRTDEHDPAYRLSGESCTVDFLLCRTRRHKVLVHAQPELSVRCDKCERRHGKKMRCNSWFLFFCEYLVFWFLLRAFGTPVYTRWPHPPHGTPFRVGLLRFRALRHGQFLRYVNNIVCHTSRIITRQKYYISFICPTQNPSLFSRK